MSLKHCFRFRNIPIFVALFLATVRVCAQAVLSDHMTLAEIERAMERFPPSWEFGDPRALIMQSLDRIMNIQIRKGWTDDEKARLRPVRDFYRRRADRALDVLAAARVTEGVRIFKFYSSSFVLKSAEGTVALDFSEGPIYNTGEPETRDEYGSGFYLAPEQRDRLAALVDASLITHCHHDHADYSLSKRLAARGKPIVGPAQLQSHWKDLAGAITVPHYGTVQRVGPCEIFTLRGCQFSTSTVDANGQKTGVPNKAQPGRDTETVAYLLRIGGIVFLQCAENHVPADDWLRKGVALGLKPNVRLSIGQYQGQRSLETVLKTLSPCFVIPLHEYELMHDAGGNRTGPRLQGAARAAFDRRQAMPLLWGEDFLLTPAMVEFSR